MGARRWELLKVFELGLRFGAPDAVLSGFEAEHGEAVPKQPPFCWESPG